MKVSAGKGSAGKGSAGKGSGEKGSGGKESAGIGSAGKGSAGKGSAGKRFRVLMNSHKFKNCPPLVLNSHLKWNYSHITKNNLSSKI